MVDVEAILGLVIIAVGIITLIRLIKPILEGVIVIAIIIVGSALLFHSTPILGISNLNFPVNIGPNIFGVSTGASNTINIVVFNAYAFTISSFSVTLNGKSVSVLNGLALQPAKFGVVTINGTQHGEISLSASSNILGFQVGTLSASYNYTG